MARYLGLDSSTQGLAALIIDTDTGDIVCDGAVNFGSDLPEYRCPQGFLQHPDPLVKHADPLMWAAALDLLLGRMRDAGVDLGAIDAVSGSGQQHGTVYLSDAFPTMPVPESGETLADAVRPLLTRATSPIWMDSSTGPQCKAITAAAGGAAEVQTRTGSPAVERFAGPQVRKFRDEAPEAYANTGTIHLVSSYLCSLLIGGNAPIDLGDGAGMNLINLAAGTWDDLLLDATAPGLADRLPPVVPSATVVGSIHSYFVNTYGFAPGTRVAAWSGDNPNSLIGVGGWQPGTAVVSLGTSDTYFAAMANPCVDPDGYGHVFGNPAGGYMSLICFKNGSLAREQVKEELGLSWKQFDVDAFRETPPGNNGNVMLPFFVPEITPLVLQAGPVYAGADDFVAGRNTAARVRAIVEAQALSLKVHSGWIEESPGILRVTGGASRSPGICQVLADVFQTRVQRLDTGNSAALGAAMRAAQAAGSLSWQALTQTFCACDPERDVAPVPERTAIYADLEARFRACLRDHAG